MKTRYKFPSHQITFKHEINEEVYFMYMNKVRSARIIHISIKKDKRGVEIWYVIDKNPCGSSHTKNFNENELFGSKADLLESL